ncbi:hypothetical protein D0859_01974 [Hortaea werneckii]|uniref:Uncharacterized protein n=1 Tax=Hortaea werneckii TaxID=91943 RepID=A0A3M7J823_HORWE|nr:hypothetical protein D0859_01974 [Hortaea werneckii]
MEHLRFLSWNSSGRSKVNALEDEQLMSKESGKLETQLRILCERQGKLRRWIIGLSILVGILALALLGAVSHSTRDPDGEQTMLSPVPRMPRTKVTFEEDKLFANGSNPKSDEAWATLTPQGDGFILLPNNTRQQWDLEPGKPTKAGEVYDISVFHELHCLRHIRTHTFTLQALIGEDDPQKIYDLLLKPTEDHVFHCFDYIRQALMCAGDMTIEWPRVEADGSRFAVDGWGITHECKSWCSCAYTSTAKCVRPNCDPLGSPTLSITPYCLLCHTSDAKGQEQCPYLEGQ